jgi:hypothetical protein
MSVPISDDTADLPILVVVDAHLEIHIVVGVLFLDERQQLSDPIVVVTLRQVLDRSAVVNRAGGIRAERQFVILHSQNQLAEIICTLHPAGRLASRLHGRQQQSHQNANNRDHYQ